MSQDTKIEWADAVIQPTSGCRRVSPGCGDGAVDGTPAPGGGCYAERAAYRLSLNPKVDRYKGLVAMTAHGPRWTGVARVNEDELKGLLRHKRGEPKRFFVDSMADLFYEGITDADLDRFFAVALALVVLEGYPRHLLLILTKRAERMRTYLSADPSDLVRRWAEAGNGTIHMDDGDVWFSEYVEGLTAHAFGPDGTAPRLSPREPYKHLDGIFPLPNARYGISAESQEWFDARAPHLMATPAAGRFFSLEPLLGPIEMSGVLGVRHGTHYEALPHNNCMDPRRCDCACDACARAKVRPAGAPDQVIVGCESGPKSRSMQLAWAERLRDECRASGVAFFLKQAMDGKRKVSLPLLGGVQWVEQPPMPAF